MILAYEIGLTQFLSNEGFRCQVPFPLEMLRQRWRQNWRVRRRLGPRLRRNMHNSVYYPDLLIEAGMPQVTVSLL